jgi:hypothetical protein
MHDVSVQLQCLKQGNELHINVPAVMDSLLRGLPGALYKHERKRHKSFQHQDSKAVKGAIRQRSAAKLDVYAFNSTLAARERVCVSVEAVHGDCFGPVDRG